MAGRTLGANLQKPKNPDKQATKLADEAKARKLLSQAVREIHKAEHDTEKEVGLEAMLADLRKRKAGHYWEAGRLLTDARKLAPHGTWTRLLKEANLPPVQDHDWRLLHSEFPDPAAIQDVKITEALDLARENRAARRKSVGGPPNSDAAADASQMEKHQSDPPRNRAGAEVFGFRIWSEPGGDNLPIVHAVRKGQRGWTPQCRNQWDLGLGSEVPPTGQESDVNCPKCRGRLAELRAEGERREAANRPHGSEIGYVWEILDGDDPDAIDARWLPITVSKGKQIVTPEKTFVPSKDEPVFQDRREALEDAKAKYEREVEADRAEIERLKAEEFRLRQEQRLAERKLARVESLLAQEA